MTAHNKETPSLRDYFAAHASEEDIACWIPATTGECSQMAHKLGIVSYPPRPQETVIYMAQNNVSRKLRYWARYQHADAMLNGAAPAQKGRE